MPGILCEHCTAACCRYIALPIDEPTDRKEFDDIRWYLMHSGVSVFVEDGDWYICIQTACRHLQPDHRCGIYETRPQICRDYTTEACDYHSGDYGWEHHFTSPEHLDIYRREYFAKKKTRRKKATSKRTASQGASRGRKRGGVKAHPDPFRHQARRKRTLEPIGLLDKDIRGTPLPVLRIGQ